MASNEQHQVLTAHCKRCKLKVSSGYKCKKCASSFHERCAIKNNVILNDKNDVLCCESNNKIIMAGSDEFLDVLESIDETQKVDYKVLKYIIRQKDIIIQELRDKIILLDEKILLLNKIDALQENKQKPKFAMSMKKVEVKSSPTETTRLSMNDVSESNFSEINKHNENMTITSEQVASAIQQTETVMKCQEVISLNNVNNVENNTGCKSECSVTNSEFKSVKYSKNKSIINKRNNNVVMGSKVSDIKTVPKFIDIHVYRLHPNTKSEDLCKYLKSSFPEVICDTISSKHPDQYTSFKVSVYQSNFKKAMQPEVWPAGACINKFFYQRQKKTQIT